MPASYDTSGDMVFTSCDTIIKNFVFLAQVVEKLDDSYFEFFTVPQIRERKKQIRERKKLIIQDLALDTAFKLLSKLEAEIRQDYNATIARKRKDELSKRYMSLCKKFRGRIRGYNEPLEKICKEVALDDILDEIKLSFKDTHPDFSKHCSALKGYFKFRHWYAHGRYFRTPAVPVPREIQQLCDEFNLLVFSRT